MAIAKSHVMDRKCSPVDREHAPNARPMVAMHRHAWLEDKAGLWHFLTDLFADLHDSNRRWSGRQRALDELLKEENR